MIENAHLNMSVVHYCSYLCNCSQRYISSSCRKAFHFNEAGWTSGGYFHKHTCINRGTVYQCISVEGQALKSPNVRLYIIAELIKMQNISHFPERLSLSQAKGCIIMFHPVFHWRKTVTATFFCCLLVSLLRLRWRLWVTVIVSAVASKPPLILFLSQLSDVTADAQGRAEAAV